MNNNNNNLDAATLTATNTLIAEGHEYWKLSQRCGGHNISGMYPSARKIAQHLILMDGFVDERFYIRESCKITSKEVEVVRAALRRLVARGELSESEYMGVRAYVLPYGEDD